jgi:uncharacterized protein (TIGR00251 family)
MFEDLKKKLYQDKELLIRVKIHPGAKENMVKGIMDDGVIKIDIAAAPEKGRANAVLIKFLSQEFEVPKDNIKILNGWNSKIKSIKLIVSF